MQYLKYETHEEYLTELKNPEYLKAQQAKKAEEALKALRDLEDPEDEKAQEYIQNLQNLQNLQAQKNLELNIERKLGETKASLSRIKQNMKEAIRYLEDTRDPEEL